MPDQHPTSDVVDDVLCAPFAPVPATSHQKITATAPIAQHAARRRLWPVEPWRFILLAAALIAAAFCGPAAASPGFNGADLGVLLSLTAFAAAFTIRSKGKTR